MCIAPEDVQDHFKHGDSYGPCKPDSCDEHKWGNSRRIKVYPNPAHDQLTVYVNNMEAGATIQLFTMNGILVRLVKLTSPVQNIAVKDVRRGIYFIVVRNGTQISTERVMIR
jgi:hypothetical protein